MKRFLPLAGFIGLFWAGMGSAHAACTLPYILQNGTIPNATQVMADFYALLNCINSGTPGPTPTPTPTTCAANPGVCPFSIPMFWPGLPPANQVVRISLTDAVTCPASLPTSEGAAKTGATGSPVVNIYQVTAGTPTLRGTATFTGATPTFAAASAINFAVGDVVQYQFPATQDATLADVSLTLHCNRTTGSAVAATGSPLNDANIWVGNGMNVAAPQVPSGDVSMTDAGVFTVLKIHGTTVPASPTVNQTILATGATTAVWGLVPNASLVNPLLTVNGITCTLGTACTITAGASNLVIAGTAGTMITGGTSGYVLYNAGGFLGNLQTVGTGSVVLGSSPQVTVTGTPCTVGSFCNPPANLPTINPNTYLGNASNVNAQAASVALLSCSGNNKGSQYTTNTGFTCASDIANLDVADQVITGGATMTSLSQSAGNITVDCGARPGQYIANTGAFTLTAPSNDGYCYLDVENGASAGTITLSGFSPNTMGGATLDTTNGHNFRLVISRVHAHSNIFAVALQ